MRLLIEIPDEQYEYIKKSDKNTFAAVSSKECMLYAIKNGIPYDTSGDLISRSALKKAFNKWWGCDDIPATVVEDIIDNAPTVEPCYQTTSCLDCGNYDKENHNCPRYCEVIKEAINSRPHGGWN